MEKKEKYYSQIIDLYNRKLSLSVGNELTNLTFKFGDKSKIEEQVRQKHIKELDSKDKYILKCPSCIDGTVEIIKSEFGEYTETKHTKKCNRCNGTRLIAVLEDDLHRYISVVKGIK